MKGSLFRQVDKSKNLKNNITLDTDLKIKLAEAAGGHNIFSIRKQNNVNNNPKVYFYCPFNQTYTKFEDYNISKILDSIRKNQSENYFIIQIDNDRVLYEEILKMQFNNEFQNIHKMFDLELDYSFSPFYDSLFFNMSILTDFFYDQIEKYLIQIFFHNHGIYIINKDSCEHIHEIFIEKFNFFFIDKDEFFQKAIKDKSNKKKNKKIFINDFKLKKIIEKNNTVDLIKSQRKIHDIDSESNYYNQNNENNNLNQEKKKIKKNYFKSNSFFQPNLLSKDKGIKEFTPSLSGNNGKKLTFEKRKKNFFKSVGGNTGLPIIYNKETKVNLVPDLKNNFHLNINDIQNTPTRSFGDKTIDDQLKRMNKSNQDYVNCDILNENDEEKSNLTNKQKTEENIQKDKIFFVENCVEEKENLCSNEIDIKLEQNKEKINSDNNKRKKSELNIKFPLIKETESCRDIHIKGNFCGKNYQIWEMDEITIEKKYEKEKIDFEICNKFSEDEKNASILPNKKSLESENKTQTNFRQDKNKNFFFNENLSDREKGKSIMKVYNSFIDYTEKNIHEKENINEKNQIFSNLKLMEEENSIKVDNNFNCDEESGNENKINKGIFLETTSKRNSITGNNNRYFIKINNSNYENRIYKGNLDEINGKLIKDGRKYSINSKKSKEEKGINQEIIEEEVILGDKKVDLLENLEEVERIKLSANLATIRRRFSTNLTHTSKINFSTDELIYHLLIFSLEKLEEYMESLVKEADSLKGIYLELSEKERKDFFRRIHSLEVSMHIIFKETIIKKKFFENAKGQFKMFNKLSNDFYFKNNFSFFLELMISKVTQIELTFEKLEKFLNMIKENYHIIIEDNTEKENIKLNNVIKVLTILTTIYAPMNIIPGLFGMNVKVPFYIDDNNNLYPFLSICLVLLFLLIVQLIIFKKLRWF